eukprot:gene10479-1903_t
MPVAVCLAGSADGRVSVPYIQRAVPERPHPLRRDCNVTRRVAPDLVPQWLPCTVHAGTLEAPAVGTLPCAAPALRDRTRPPSSTTGAYLMRLPRRVPCAVCRVSCSSVRVRVRVRVRACASIWVLTPASVSLHAGYLTPVRVSVSVLRPTQPTQGWPMPRRVLEAGSR